MNLINRRVVERAISNFMTDKQRRAMFARRDAAHRASPQPAAAAPPQSAAGNPPRQGGDPARRFPEDPLIGKLRPNLPPAPDRKPPAPPSAEAIAAAVAATSPATRTLQYKRNDKGELVPYFDWVMEQARKQWARTGINAAPLPQDPRLPPNPFART
jgi:hypothetical protein